MAPLLRLPYDCASHVLAWLPVRDKCALRAAAAAYRREFHLVRVGMLLHVFGEYIDDVFSVNTSLLTPFDYFAHFADVLLAAWDHRAPRRSRRRRATLLLKAPVSPLHFAALADWRHYHFEKTAEPRYLDDIYRLPLNFRVGSPSRYRSLKALVY